MMPRALRIQEICDHICDDLYWETCSLDSLVTASGISPGFTPSAQRYIFHTIRISPAFPRVNVGRLCRRLSAVLQESPHLIRFIRDLRISLEPDVMVAFAGVHFTHLETVTLHPPTRFPPALHPSYDGSTLSLASNIIALPSLRQIELRLNNISLPDLCALFYKRTAALDCILLDVNISPGSIASLPERDRFPTKKLEMWWEQRDPPTQDQSWLLHPCFPLDFSALEDLQMYCKMSPTVISIIHMAKSSLRSLHIDDGDATTVVALGDLPALKNLCIIARADDATSTVGILSSGVANAPMLESLVIRVLVTRTLDEESLRHLDAIFAGFHPPLRAIEVDFRSTHMGLAQRIPEFELLMQGVRALFPLSVAKGYSTLSYGVGCRFLFS
ncbi:hypothetical protein DFH06DRAFT_1233534 [Mycena polygramma]|nr:hypothetical protein DFH06DRAFT_1233534 [Mycena polygramma]